jgi:hypothetical protein
MFVESGKRSSSKNERSTQIKHNLNSNTKFRISSNNSNETIFFVNIDCECKVSKKYMFNI